MGCAAQVTAASLTGEMGRETRATAGLFLVHNLVHIIASDAHRTMGARPDSAGPSGRRPNSSGRAGPGPW